MTTTVVVTTHSWPVKVTTHDKLADGTVADTSSTIEPNSTSSQYITSTRSLSVDELPLPDASAASTDDAA